ncbi:MAG: phage portal protein, partial [Kiloniellaceae bacterium]
AMRHAPRSPFVLGTLARTRFDYAREVGDGIDSSVVTAPVQWIQRAFPEAPLKVLRTAGGESEEVEAHPLLDLIARPNPFYGGAQLWSPTLMSYLVAGNAYWLKVRNGAGRVAELWYAPHWTLSPKWPQDGSEFISHWEYRPGGGAGIVRLEPDDLVHFRHGIDPRNPRLGLSPLHGVIREIFMDLEASNFVASLLRNLGVPGVVISPEGGVQAATDDVAAVKAWFKSAFGGDRRGEPLVMGAATKVQQYGFDARQLDLSAARDVAEERVCACLGVPAAIVGFGAGLQTAKVGATMEELRALAWTNGIIPIQRAFADILERQILADVSEGAADEEVVFDSGEVIAIEDHLLKRAQRWGAMVTGGFARVDEAREAMGLEVEDADRIFLRHFSAIEVPAGQAPRQPSVPERPGSEQAAFDPGGRRRPARRRPGEGGKQRRRRPSRAQAAYVRALEALEPRLAAAFEPRLRDFFAGLGQAAAEAAAPLVDMLPPAQTAPERAGGPPPVAKQSAEEILFVGRVLDDLDIPRQSADFRRVYETHYLNVAQKVSEAGELIGLAVDLPDPVARAVVAAGGRRSGLVDLESQSRRALFDALAEGRAAGEGAEQLAERIAEHVGSGPWTTAEIRARTIARTETKFAQNVSTVARAQHAGVRRFIVFDGRLGPGRSTPSHIARDGIVVTADEAAQMAAEEHPNGTLSFSPFLEEIPDDEDEDS